VLHFLFDRAATRPLLRKSSHISNRKATVILFVVCSPHCAVSALHFSVVVVLQSSQVSCAHSFSETAIQSQSRQQRRAAEYYKAISDLLSSRCQSSSDAPTQTADDHSRVCLSRRHRSMWVSDVKSLLHLGSRGSRLTLFRFFAALLALTVLDAARTDFLMPCDDAIRAFLRSWQRLIHRRSYFTQ